MGTSRFASSIALHDNLIRPSKQIEILVDRLGAPYQRWKFPGASWDSFYWSNKTSIDRDAYYVRYQ